MEGPVYVEFLFLLQVRRGRLDRALWELRLLTAVSEMGPIAKVA